MIRYLESTKYIDWDQPEILTVARKIAHGLNTDEAIAQACFEYTRDEIRHSWDHQLNPVTCRASEVLRHRTGFCYAKSHLLAALLRACRIPAGLCYQRLAVEGSKRPYCLHGLNAVYLKSHGWYRIDARGNKLGVHAGFCPPVPRLAFSGTAEGEASLLEIFFEPLPSVIKALEEAQNFQEVASDLPDFDLSPFASEANSHCDAAPRCQTT